MNLASLADQNLEQLGEYERLVCAERSYTNRTLHERSLRLAAGLRALGLESGDRVVVMMPNRPEVLISYPAVWRAGMVVVPVLDRLESRELGYIVEHSGARAVVTSSDVEPKVSQALGGPTVRPSVIVAGGPEGGTGSHVGFEELVQRNDPSEDITPKRGDELAVLLYTSGTTGRPKGVMLTHHNVYAQAMNSWNTWPRRREGDTSLLVLPLAHSFGLGVLVNGYLFGGRAVLMDRFDPEQAFALIEKHRIRAMAGVPAMFVAMLYHPNAGAYDTSSMERWLVGAAPMPPEQLRKFEAQFGGRMYVGYGLSEAAPGLAVEREELPRKPGSSGLPMEGVEVKIVDDDDRELGPGEVGEIIARGENISPGYYRMPEESERAFRGGWLYTGDMGYLDEDGYLFIVERKKDLIIRGGLNIYPKDVEDVLHQHPAVQECAVVAVPDTRMGEEVCAYVVVRDGYDVSAEELIAHCQQHLAKYKTPRHVQQVRALPKTAIGKVLKKELRQRAAAELGDGAG